MATITARKLLNEAISRFLSGEGFECRPTTTALVQSVVALGSYHEEGVALFPQVLICDDVALMAKLLLGSDVIELGSGALDPDTVRSALKQCAPLAKGSWAVFVERSDQGYRYGVFRLPSLPLAVSVEQGISGSGTRIIYARQIAENSVQLYGSRGSNVRLYLNDSDEEVPAPQDAVEKFCRAAARDVVEPDGANVVRFLAQAILRIMQTGHGCLAAAIAHDAPIPESLRDGVALSAPIDLATRIREHAVERTADTAFAVQGVTTLLRGMLDSDGITLLDTRARLRGFRIFVRAPAGGGAAIPPLGAGAASPGAGAPAAGAAALAAGGAAFAAGAGASAAGAAALAAGAAAYVAGAAVSHRVGGVGGGAPAAGAGALGGGARRRAYTALCNQPGIIAALYRSQDGITLCEDRQP